MPRADLAMRMRKSHKEPRVHFYEETAANFGFDTVRSCQDLSDIICEFFPCMYLYSTTICKLSRFLPVANKNRTNNLELSIYLGGSDTQEKGTLPS